MLGDCNLNVMDKNSDDVKHVKWIEQATGLKQYIKAITNYSNNNSVLICYLLILLVILLWIFLI